MTLAIFLQGGACRKRPRPPCNDVQEFQADGDLDHCLPVATINGQCTCIRLTVTAGLRPFEQGSSLLWWF